jgi:hypothetical protein
MRDADLNDAITKLYDKVDMYLADDQWHFDDPLAIRLCKPLRSHRQWLVNAQILVNKLEQQAMGGQCTLNRYYPHLPSVRTVRNTMLKWIGSV